MRLAGLALFLFVTGGPAVIAEADCTIWVAEGWTARVGGGGAWVLTR